MIIIHVTFGFGLGGIETMLHNIANEQARLGNDVHIVVINNIINEELRDTLDSEVHFHCLGRKVGSKNPFFIAKLNYLLYQIRPNVIHLHYNSIAPYIVLPKMKSRIGVTQHDVCHAENSKWLKSCKKIFAISNVVRQDILANMGLDSVVVLNGIKPEVIKTKENKSNDKFRIVQVSRLMHEKKGQHILIKAIALLVHKGYKNISLDLIGDGESMEYLKNLSEQIGVGANVNFLGAKDQTFVFEHLCEYDLFVQPSIYEGFGLTVAEGMAARIPVLVSENQGPLEIIDYGNYGYSFKNQDYEDCAAKIEMFLTQRNDKNIIEKAYQRVLSLYNVKNTARQYLDLYTTI